MKYLYYGMSRPEDGYSPNLLVWHSSVGLGRAHLFPPLRLLSTSILFLLSTKLQVVTAGGPGTIVRVLTERKTVW